MTTTSLWITVLITSIGSFVLKLAGQSLPERVLQVPRVRRLALLMPIALLTALTTYLTFGDGRALTIDARVVGVVFAVGALLARAPFIVVVVGAAAAAAAARLVAG
jgi:hypothetical protein